MLLNAKPTINLNQISSKATQISQQLIESAKNYQNKCLVIIDPFLAPINDPIIHQFKKTGQLHQVLIMHSAIRIDQRPCILELNLTQEYDKQTLLYITNKALLQLTPQHELMGCGRHYCAWLFTNKEVNYIVNDISKTLLQTKEEKGKTFLFRYFDAMIFPQLMSTLTLFQKSRLFGLIELWGIITNEEKLVTYHNPDRPTAVMSGQLYLTDEQIKKLYCIGINNQIIKMHRLINPSQNIDVIAYLNKITPCIERILNKNINDEALIIEWGKLALKLGADFDLDPKVQEKIKDLTTSQAFYPVVSQLHALNKQNYQSMKEE
ncbi:hypothetical protein RCS94_03785 [Orbaceae bacterium ac157xtp]